MVEQNNYGMCELKFKHINAGICLTTLGNWIECVYNIAIVCHHYTLKCLLSAKMVLGADTISFLCSRLVPSTNIHRFSCFAFIRGRAHLCVCVIVLSYGVNGYIIDIKIKIAFDEAFARN